VSGRGSNGNFSSPIVYTGGKAAGSPSTPTTVPAPPDLFLVTVYTIARRIPSTLRTMAASRSLVSYTVWTCRGSESTSQARAAAEGAPPAVSNRRVARS